MRNFKTWAPFMLSTNKAKFEHRLKTIIGILRRVLKEVNFDPSTNYGRLHTAERAVRQASMFIVKDLIDQTGDSQNPKKAREAIKELYDCLGFHRDELPHNEEK